MKKMMAVFMLLFVSCGKSSSPKLISKTSTPKLSKTKVEVITDWAGKGDDYWKRVVKINGKILCVESYGGAISCDFSDVPLGYR